MNSKEAKEAKTGDKVTLRLSTQDNVTATIEYKAEKMIMQYQYLR